MAITVNEPAVTAAGPARPLRVRRVRLPRSPKVLIGFGLLIAFLILAIVGPSLAPYDPSAALALSGTPHPPSAAHWLGTTQTQQDVLSQMLVPGAALPAATPAPSAPAPAQAAPAHPSATPPAAAPAPPAAAPAAAARRRRSSILRGPWPRPATTC